MRLCLCLEFHQYHQKLAASPRSVVFWERQIWLSTSLHYCGNGGKIFPRPWKQWDCWIWARILSGCWGGETLQSRLDFSSIAFSVNLHLAISNILIGLHWKIMTFFSSLRNLSPLSSFFWNQLHRLTIHDQSWQYFVRAGVRVQS